MPKPAPILLPLAILSVLTGVLTGLYRIGWFGLPSTGVGEHGAIMVGCFMGTLVSLERAVALKNKYTFVVPLLSASSLLAFLLGFQSIAYALLITSSIALTAVTLYFQSHFSPSSFIILFTGTVYWLLGNVMLVLWKMYPVAISWWMGFILFTIVSSRVKASTTQGTDTIKQYSLFLSLGVFTIGLLMPFHGVGRYWMASGLIGTALWLIRYDLAWEMIKKEGVSSYSGILLFNGFLWLLATGGFMLKSDLVGPMYDTAVHSFFIGFLFSVVMAHGPMILPTILTLSVKPFHKILYLWFVLMEGSLIVRIIANFFNEFTIRKWAGLLNGVAIVAFFITMAILLFIELRKTRKQSKILFSN